MSLDINLTNVESTTNKKTDLTDNSDTFYPTQKAVKTAVDLKVDANAPITGATKTKVTYDSKGLVTAGADATTADIADSTDKRYVTDAQLTVIGNTSGTNTGDQDLSGYVQDSDFSSHSVLAKQSGAGSPTAVTIGTNEILGRLSGGGADIEGLSTSQVKTLLDLAGTNTGDETTASIKSKLGVTDWIDYSGTTTVDGYSSTTEIYVIYKKLDDQTMHVMFRISGVSNDTVLTFTLPNNVRAGVGTLTLAMFSCVNNGVYRWVQFLGTEGSNVITAIPTAATAPTPSTWNASGTKSIYGSLTIPI